MNETVNNPNLTEEIRKEVQDTTNLQQLQEVMNKHKGLGKEFYKLIKKQKHFIENADH